MKKLIIALLIALLAAEGIVATADTFGGDGFNVKGLTIPGGRWWRMPAFAQKLSLTPDEQSKLDTLFAQNRRQMVDLKGGVSKEIFELEEILDKKELNEAECMKRFDKLQEARGKLASSRFRYLLDIRKIMGSERYQQLKTNFQERRMNRMKGARGGGRQPQAGKKENAKTPE